MKKLIVIYAFTIVTTYSFGQFSYGLNGGININDQKVSALPDIDESFSYQSNIGFHFGLFGLFTITDKISLMPELQFTQRGGTYYGTRKNLNYIELPALFLYSLTKQLSVDLGPTISYKISAHYSEHNIDFGILAGIRYQLAKHDKVSFYARYYYGLGTANKWANDVSLVRYTENNRTIQFGVYCKLK